MAVAFHVFVEGATDGSPGGLARLAEAIGKHYGIRSTDLHDRLQKGRFRVKGNADLPTAQVYKRDLERLGAICTIEEANAENSQRATPLPFPAVRPDTPPAGLAAVNVARTATMDPSNPAFARAPTLAAPVSARAPTPLAVEPVLQPRTSTPPAGTPSPARASTPPPVTLAQALPPRTTAPPPVAASLPPRTTATPPMGSPSARASTPPPIAATPPPGANQFQSGLSAAFSGEQPAADLGALGALGSGDAFSLSSVDGADGADGASPSCTFGPSDGSFASASIGPAPDKPTKKAAGPAAARPKDEPLDMFLPPDAQGEELSIGIDDAEFSSRKRAGTPPPVETERPSTPAGRKSQPSMQTPNTRRSEPMEVPNTPAQRRSEPSMQVPNTPAQRRSEPSMPVPSVSRNRGPLGDERVRFAAGVVLAIVIGFAPAHFIAAMREESSFKTIDTKVIVAQQQAETPETYALLDKLRADQLDRKVTEHRNAAIIGFAVWALVAAGFAFVWFKKIRWE